jgi:hypothetical protein
VYVNELSFDPRHPWFPVPGLLGAQWSVEVFTTQNVQCPDPAQTRFDGQHLASAGLQWLGGQRQVRGRVHGDVRVEDDGSVLWRLSTEMPDTVKGIKLLLRGLPAHLLAEGWWTPTTPSDVTLRPALGTPVQLNYPWFEWQTPWACAGEGPGVVLSVRDNAVRPKRFYTYLPHWASTAIVEVTCDEVATERSRHFEAPEIRLQVCETREKVKLNFDGHLKSLEQAFGLTPWNQRTDVPAWADGLELVLMLHGQHWTGYVFNTFDEMAAVLEDVTGDVPGDRILAYLPGWEGRYYWQYPEYGPSEDLGGPAAFERLVTTARNLGVHLMPMFGANGAHVDRYPEWKDAAFRSPSNRYVALVNTPDWDNDRDGEDEQVFLNPGELGFQQFLAQQVSAVVKRYGIEGVFLDTSACWFNDPRHDVFRGYVDLVGRLHEENPGLLVCGEGWYDALLAVFPMNQTWIQMEVPPRFDDLPMKYARVLGHLKDGAPGVGSTGVHEGGLRPKAKPLRIPGFVPALSVVEDTFSDHRDEVRAFCAAIQRETS